MSNTFFSSIEIFTRDTKSTDINAYNVYGDDDADEDDDGDHDVEEDDDADEDDCRLGTPLCSFCSKK